MHAGQVLHRVIPLFYSFFFSHFLKTGSCCIAQAVFKFVSSHASQVAEAIGMYHHTGWSPLFYFIWGTGDQTRGLVHARHTTTELYPQTQSPLFYFLAGLNSGSWAHWVSALSLELLPHQVLYLKWKGLSHPLCQCAASWCSQSAVSLFSSGASPPPDCRATGTSWNNFLSLYQVIWLKKKKKVKIKIAITLH